MFKKFLILGTFLFIVVGVSLEVLQLFSDKEIRVSINNWKTGQFYDFLLDEESVEQIRSVFEKAKKEANVILNPGEYIGFINKSIDACDLEIKFSFPSSTRTYRLCKIGVDYFLHIRVMDYSIRNAVFKLNENQYYDLLEKINSFIKKYIQTNKSGSSL